MSGGADKTVRFWKFELVDDEENKTKLELIQKLFKNFQRFCKLI